MENSIVNYSIKCEVRQGVTILLTSYVILIEIAKSHQL